MPTKKRRERYHVYLPRVNYKQELLQPPRFLEGGGTPAWERFVLADSYMNALAQVVEEAQETEFKKLRGEIAAFSVGVKGSVSKKAERLDPIRVSIQTGLPVGRWKFGFTNWEAWKHPRNERGQFRKTGTNKIIAAVRSTIK